MKPPPRSNRWRRNLSSRLNLRLMLPLLVIVAATGAIGAYIAQRLTDRVFDRWLLDSARAIAAQVRFDAGVASIDLPPAAENIVAYDEADRTYFSVAQSGRKLAGRPDIPATGARRSHYPMGSAFDAEVDGEPVRVATVEVDGATTGRRAPVTVLVAETLHKREAARSDLLEMLLPLVAMLLAAVAAIATAVRRTIRPLEKIAASWNERSAASLQTIDVEGVPRELMPFASALNDLLARIRAMLARERQFALTAAHQLRTPLAGLQLGLARAAAACDLTSTRAVIAELERTTQRTARLIQQLLALGRLDPEIRRDLSFEATDAAVLAHDVGAAYLDQALAQRVALELKAESPPVVLRLNRDLIAEALGNLLDNALRYTPAGGQILIEVEQDPPAIHVADSGAGIEADESETLFERFVRGRRAVGDGSGLGLAIVREIAELHGATVDLSRAALGGLRVSIRFHR